MKLLLDTHVFLWWVSDAPELSDVARAAISDPGNTCYLSLASCWELSIKSSIGKLKLKKPVERFISEQMQQNGFLLLDIDCVMSPKSKVWHCIIATRLIACWSPKPRPSG